MSSTTSPYAKERRIAELAVDRAGLLTTRVQKSHVLGTSTKSDDSPVTFADLGAQALVIATIAHVFPGDLIVAEEDSRSLRGNDSRRETLWDYVSAVLKETSESTNLLPDVIGSIRDETEMMDLIDRGSYEGGKVGRIWVLDPVDGTKGFLRGGQYAICLGLVVDGHVVVGAINCPNLYVDPKDPESGHGIVVSSERGHGSTMRPAAQQNRTAEAASISICMNAITSFTDASFCQGVEAAHSSQEEHALLAEYLGITKPPLCMDSQAKYVSVARGHADIYLRLQKDPSYREKIWDHAAGTLIVEECGGKVSDMYGKELDFSLGRTLKENVGVIVAPKNLHAKVIEAIQAVVINSSLKP